MSIVSYVHQHGIYERRLRQLCRHLSPLLNDSRTVADVGCGDGRMAGLLQQMQPQCTFQGFDVLVRPQTMLPVRQFDGIHLPLPDKSVDSVLMIDVLHHTLQPDVLLQEARRVACRWILLKDHTPQGFLGDATLRLMDYVGNARHGVALPYNYLSLGEWHRLFGRLGLSIDCWKSRLLLYGMPLDLLFGRRLHFIARLEP